MWRLIRVILFDDWGKGGGYHYAGVGAGMKREAAVVIVDRLGAVQLSIHSTT